MRAERTQLIVRGDACRRSLAARVCGDGSALCDDGVSYDDARGGAHVLANEGIDAGDSPEIHANEETAEARALHESVEPSTSGRSSTVAERERKFFNSKNVLTNLPLL